MAISRGLQMYLHQGSHFPPLRSLKDRATSLMCLSQTLMMGRVFLTHIKMHVFQLLDQQEVQRWDSQSFGGENGRKLRRLECL